ncbi:MAG: glutamine--fructose-6-phosphate transaminase (isomerizing) [Candidatus Woesearchaeota archaeon]|jgi:glucosamine--fructose-6-phosphate aminotransferase (isomerizing)|nr:glutamine--fructose-6-phosphate transaminase (isomerizing) [Candidatus Woesearchaeota archaeon]MDP7179926.1 glutamine--fructose-6-phosphate transaminase (isomerizing) [Candidatus Woesearchaeota archaeon]MDP7458430.1 glutamine--fructose-6-phosphate transaminase (isomerizing) [Candidatus Woesearchaeota archaeon]
MCGIVGLVSKREVSKILLECIRKLEYRGYDSVGMVCCDGKDICTKKDIGKIDEVDKKVNFIELNGNMGLAHSRWSTHGRTTKENAHPHTDCTGDVSIVHNGIIENHLELKEELIKKGHKFSTETDTEVIAHLIEENYKGDLKDAVLAAVGKIEGSYGLGVVHKNHDEIVAARNESPLIVGIGDGENFICSDVPAILKYTRNVVYLGNEEVAVVTTDKVEFFDVNGEWVDKKVEKIDWDAEQAQKQGYKHFMLKEIFEQPRAISETINGRLDDSDILIKDEIGLSVDEIKKVKKIVIVACGTSWHAGLVGEFMIEELTRIPVEVEYASEFRYRNPIVDKTTIVIAISQSGETADTLAAMKEAKKKRAKVISIVNVKGSSIERESDSTVYTHSGPEIGVASTKAFTSQLVVLYLMTVYFGKVKGVLPQEQVRNRIRDLRRVPLQIQSILEDSDYIKECAELYYKRANALYLGRGINYPIALEGALKLKEVSYVHAEGYPAAEMKHGPIALIDKDMPVVFVATKDDRTYSKILGNIEETKSRGGIVIAIITKGDKGLKEKVDTNVHIPKNSYILTPLLSVVPLQLLAYYIADKRGCDIDKPRNLAKSVTVE